MEYGVTVLCDGIISNAQKTVAEANDCLTEHLILKARRGTEGTYSRKCGKAKAQKLLPQMSSNQKPS